MAERNGGTDVEATNTPFGSFKVSGANLNMIFTVFGFIITCMIATILWSHHEEARAGGKEVARELKEANKEVATALKESNREVARVMNELTRAMREANCLAQFPSAELKAQNADLCKRMSQ